MSKFQVHYNWVHHAPLQSCFNFIQIIDLSMTNTTLILPLNTFQPYHKDKKYQNIFFPKKILYQHKHAVFCIDDLGEFLMFILIDALEQRFSKCGATPKLNVDSRGNQSLVESFNKLNNQNI